MVVTSVMIYQARNFFKYQISKASSHKSYFSYVYRGDGNCFEVWDGEGGGGGTPGIHANLLLRKPFFYFS